MMMRILAFIDSVGPAVLDHLWQTTAFVAVVWVTTLALWKNAARVRYGLWLAGSVKFLVPFSLLMGLGSLLPAPQSVVTGTEAPVYSAVDVVTQPFREVATAAPVAHVASWDEWMPMLLGVVWLCGVLVVLAVWVRRWWQMAEVLRRESRVEEGRVFAILRRLDPRGQVALVQTEGSMEPGVFGVWRPVLLWPEGLSELLEDEHIEAIVAHEVMHVRRLDNLTAMLLHGGGSGVLVSSGGVVDGAADGARSVNARAMRRWWSWGAGRGCMRRVC